MTIQINYQVSDSGCVVTVCDTGAASLSPPGHGSRRAAPTAAASPHVTRQLTTWLRILPNCPTLQYLILHSLIGLKK
jgi:hypothetical protein